MSHQQCAQFCKLVSIILYEGVLTNLVLFSDSERFRSSEVLRTKSLSKVWMCGQDFLLVEGYHYLFWAQKSMYLRFIFFI